MTILSDITDQCFPSKRRNVLYITLLNEDICAAPSHLSYPSRMAMEVNSESDHNRALTRKILWKLDCHILPSLALVRLKCTLTTRILSEEPLVLPSAMAR